MVLGEGKVLGEIMVLEELLVRWELMFLGEWSGLISETWTD